MIQDGNGERLFDGDKVFTYDFGWKKVFGTLHKETVAPDEYEWFVKYDDGEEFVVLDFDSIWKA